MMRKPNAKGRSKRGFIMLLHEVTSSPAWKDLSPHAAKLLIEIWSRHRGSKRTDSNNGRISYSHREAVEALHCGKRKVGPAFQELVDHGFIKRHRLGAFNVKDKYASEWEVTAEDLPDGTPATHDYRRWKPEARTVRKTIDGPHSGDRTSTAVGAATHHSTAHGYQRGGRAA